MDRAPSALFLLPFPRVPNALPSSPQALRHLLIEVSPVTMLFPIWELTAPHPGVWQMSLPRADAPAKFLPPLSSLLPDSVVLSFTVIFCFTGLSLPSHQYLVF